MASDLPGTRLTVGDAVSSVVDQATKPRDVYALSLPAGQRLRVTVTATSADYDVTLGDPDAVPGAISAADGRRLYPIGPTCTATVPIAATGSYLLVIDAQGPGVRYTLHTAALPGEVGQGVTNLTAQVASDLPGTALTVGNAVTSVLDQGTKPRDVYALTLRAGQTLAVDLTADSADYDVLLLPPGAASVVRAAGRFQGTRLCAVGPACHATASIAAAGGYTLVVEASGPGLQYTLRTAAP